MAWLVNSKEPEIGQIHMFLSTTKELRDAVIETYSDPGNSAQVYELKTKIWEPKQGNHSVIKYHNIWKACCMN